MGKNNNSNTIKRHKGDKRRPTLKKRFLALLLEQTVLGNVSTACDILKIDRTGPYRWRKTDAKFAKAWDDQQELADNLLSDKAENALLKGIDAGNATLIIFTLKNRRPARWRDKFEHTGEDGGPIEYLHELSPEFAESLAEFYKGKHGKDKGNTKDRPSK